MKKKSIWSDTIKNTPCESLKKDLMVDVLIIGGGMTGLSAAYHLKDSNLRVCLVERNTIGSGVSSKTTGKLTYLQDNIYSNLNKENEKNVVKRYFKSQIDSIKMVHDIILKEHILCDFSNVSSYLFTNEAKTVSLVKEETEMLNRLGCQTKKLKSIPYVSDFQYGFEVTDTAVFHPLKYLYALKDIFLKHQGLIFENSTVTSIKKGDGFLCVVNDNVITAKTVVLATHYPTFLHPLFLPCKSYLERSYLSASCVEKIESFSAISLSKPVVSFRFYENEKKYLMYLSNNHNLCQNYNEYQNFDDIIKQLSKFSLKPEYIWSNHDVMTIDSLPYIGLIEPNLFIGCGFNTWGMTNGSLAGKIISDMILEKENEYISLFSPKRGSSWSNKIQYPLNLSYSGKSFIGNKVNKNKNWYSEHVIFEKRNGKNVGIYIDDENKEHVVYNLCPHFKCSLLFNEVEKTWDCPCHGSRFSVNGNCIMGPSNFNIGFPSNEDDLF